MDQSDLSTDKGNVGMRRSWSSGDLDIAANTQFWDPYMDPTYYHDRRNSENFSSSQWSRSGYVSRLALIAISLSLFVFIFFGIFFIAIKTFEYAANERASHVIIDWYGCNDEYQAAQEANSTYKSKSKYLDDVFARIANDRQIKMEELMRTAMDKEYVKRYCTNVTLETTTRAMNAIRKMMYSDKKFVRK